MAIAKTRLVNITSNIDYLDRVLARFVELHDIHPVPATQFVDKVHGLTSFSSDNPCNLILKEILEIEAEFNIDIEVQEMCQIDDSLDKMKEYVESTHHKLTALLDQKKVTLDLVRKYQDALIQVKNINSLDISLDDVFSCDYVVSRVGRLPMDSVEKLRFYRNRPFIFKSFSVDKNYSWCMYFTSNDYEREVDNIFSSLFFERIHIPDFVHGTPEDAEVKLIQEIELTTSHLEKVKQSLFEVLKEAHHDISHIKSELLMLNKIYDAKKYVVGLGDKFTITGFIEQKDEKIIIEKYKDLKEVEVLFRPALSDKRLLPPTKLKNNWFTRPFSMFVEMYGIPKYGGIDPTPFVALTYSLLFGIMFADFGQGLLLALIGYYFYKKKHLQLGEVGMRIGLFSAFFGLLFGSVFGNEEILLTLYEKIGIGFLPIRVLDSNMTLYLLLSAVAIGAILILISIIINTYTNFKKKKYADVLFSPNGISGFLFYGYIIVGIVLTMIFSVKAFTPLLIVTFIVAPLLLIFLKEPLERKLEGHKAFPTGFGGFFVEGFFELFEVVLSYITNTMSFMRVGGFLLSHASMMLVVFTVMGMSSNAIITTIIFIFGNLFVMALEGMIVGIQVLRLEFYEMFSRYYEGDGVPFQTLK
ncbi:MAG: V-type ATP synthase subunit I [Candidatus Izemoplasmatales bacterium]